MYFLTGAISCVYLYLIIKFIEYIYCAFIIKQPPNVASSKIMRKKLAEHINTYYDNAKNICDIGSGYGFTARFVARNTGKQVIGIENMFFSFFVSKVFDVFCSGKSKTVWADAYEYLDKTTEVFDIAIAYLGPEESQNLKKYKKKIKVLICMDFEILDLKPVQIVDIGHGCTRFNHKLYPHRLFVYKFK